MSLKTLQTLAIERGAHIECVVSDVEVSCDECTDILNGVFFDMYGHADSSEELINLILSDIRRERN